MEEGVHNADFEHFVASLLRFAFFVDISYRGNALLFHGSPISHLPTARLFAYATHFDAHPMGLEWVDDNTAVFVFASRTSARSAYKSLQKSFEEDADEEGFVTAKSIPIALWPPEERINQSLGKGEGLKGTIRMRWAKNDDVKKKGAKKDSEFYRKHGSNAGKEKYNESREGSQKRRKGDPTEQKTRLDDDLDEFLAGDYSEETTPRPPSPPSKMRSDYIATDGRTLLERTSIIRAHPELLVSRLSAASPRRRKEGRRLAERNGARERVQHDEVADSGRRRRNGSEGKEKGWGRREAQPLKSQKELDDELDAFLNERE
jgi:hypothetical protein